jgi:hypothetical protein
MIDDQLIHIHTHTPINDVNNVANEKTERQVNGWTLDDVLPDLSSPFGSKSNDHLRSRYKNEPDRLRDAPSDE